MSSGQAEIDRLREQAEAAEESLRHERDQNGTLRRTLDRLHTEVTVLNRQRPGANPPLPSATLRRPPPQVRVRPAIHTHVISDFEHIVGPKGSATWHFRQTWFRRTPGLVNHRAKIGQVWGAKS